MLLALLQEGVANEHSLVSFFSCCAHTGKGADAVEFWRSMRWVRVVPHQLGGLVLQVQPGVLAMLGNDGPSTPSCAGGSTASWVALTRGADADALHFGAVREHPLSQLGPAGCSALLQAATTAPARSLPVALLGELREAACGLSILSYNIVLSHCIKASPMRPPPSLSHHQATQTSLVWLSLAGMASTAPHALPTQVLHSKVAFAR